MSMSVRSIGEKTHEMARVGVREVADKGSKAAETLQDARDGLSSRASDLAGSASDTLKSYGIDPKELGETALDALEEWQDALVSSVKAHPMRSIALAAAAGFVLARLGRR